MTIREIAAIAGVSPAAVSLVINNKNLAVKLIFHREYHGCLAGSG